MTVFYRFCKKQAKYCIFYTRFFMPLLTEMIIIFTVYCFMYVFTVMYIALKNCKILQCTVKFHVHFLYIFTIQCKFYRDWLADWLPAFVLGNLQYFFFFNLYTL